MVRIAQGVLHAGSQALCALNAGVQANRILPELLNIYGNADVRRGDLDHHRNAERARGSLGSHSPIGNLGSRPVRPHRKPGFRHHLPGCVRAAGGDRSRAGTAQLKRVGIERHALDLHIDLACVLQLESDGDGSRLTLAHRIKDHLIGFQAGLVGLPHIDERRAEVDVVQVQLDVASHHWTVAQRQTGAQRALLPPGHLRATLTKALDFLKGRGIHRNPGSKARIGRNRHRHRHAIPPGNAIGAQVLGTPVIDIRDGTLMSKVEHDPGIACLLAARDPELVARSVVAIDHALGHRRAIARGRIGVDHHLLIRNEICIAVARGEREHGRVGGSGGSPRGHAQLDRAIPLVRPLNIQRLPRTAVHAHLESIGNLAVKEIDAVRAVVRLALERGSLTRHDIDAVDDARADELDLDIRLGVDGGDLIGG